MSHYLITPIPTELPSPQNVVLQHSEEAGDFWVNCSFNKIIHQTKHGSGPCDLTWYSPWRALYRPPAAACRHTEPSWPPPPPTRGPPTAPQKEHEVQVNTVTQLFHRGEPGEPGWGWLFPAQILHVQACMYTNTDRQVREWSSYGETAGKTDAN